MGPQLASHPRDAAPAILLGVGVAAVCAILAGFGGLLIFFEYPGAMSGSYRAVDHDRRLGGIAREAKPMIAAVELFYARHHACPNLSQTAEMTEFLSDLGDGVAVKWHGRFVDL